MPTSLNEPTGSTQESVQDNAAELHELTDTDSSISSTFAFVGNMKNPYEVIRKTPDFDTIIVLMTKVSCVKITSF
jgi:hypothetical protein